MHTSRRFALLFLASAVAAAAPAAAEAQLGGFIRKKVEQKVSDKVREQANRPPAPTFDDQVLEITESRLDQLIRGVEAEQAAAASAGQAAAAARQQGSTAQGTYDAEMKAYRVKEHEYQVAMSKWTHCIQVSGGAAANAAAANPAMQEMMRRMAAMPAAEREALQKRMQERSEKMDAADERGDGAEKKRLFDEMDADLKKTIGMSFFDIHSASTGVPAAQANAAQACGPQPVAPLPPERPSGTAVVDVRDSVRTAATRASGLSQAQYSILRERVAAWLAHKERDRSLQRYGFTDAELEALESRRTALKAREAALLAQDNAGGWSF